MFPRYLFFKCSEQQQSLSTVRSTKGVNNLVRFGFEPARLQDKLVALIREMESSRNDITIVQASSFRAGQSVRLKHTALGNVEGLIHNVGAQRIAVLLEILGRPTVVQVEHHQIEAN
jgi:transcriptional antiterminator RfaH